MQKSFFRFAALLVLSAIFSIASVTTVFAQSVTITAVDPGPYTPGSTIAVPINIDNTSGCIAQNNVFNLYLSDASGSFANETLIGSVNGFYASFINGVIPASAIPGTGYQVRVEATQPSIISPPSSIFSITSGASLTPVLNGQTVNGGNPEVFGVCVGQGTTTPFSFSNGTTPASAVVTISFYNELTGTTEYSGPLGASGYTFNAQTANYTITVKAVNNGVVSTKSYLLINNNVNTFIGSTGNNSVCITEGGGTIIFNIAPDYLKYNYPGNTYLLTFGDGGSVTLTQCQIQAAKGQISHTYKSSSCGLKTSDGQNAFQVTLQSMNPFCGSVGTSVNTSAKIFESPFNIIDGPINACTGTPVTFKNGSYPGQNPNSTDASCLNLAAQYTWYVDGVAEKFNATVNDIFNYTFTTPGKHVVTLTLQNGSTACNTATANSTVCVSNPPQPSFNLPGKVCLSSSVTPVDKSVVDNTCAVGAYLWTVTGPGKVTYGGGTTNTSTQPQFVFSTPGIYQVTLSITSAGCGAVVSAPSTIIVDGPPVTQLSPNVSLCGSNQTLSFSTGSGPTQTTLTGTAQPDANTFTWTVTGGTYSFANSTTANSQYPQITFNDYATYTITVNQQNSCGTTTSTQNITFTQAPTVTTNGDQHICYGSTASLQGTITGTVNSYKWVGGNGTFSNLNSLATTYTPTAAEVAAGQVTVYLQAITNLPAPCNSINSPVTIYIASQVKVTSANSLNVCTSQPLNYTITGSDPASTFTWTAALTSGNATGFTVSGSGSSINDVINVTGTANAVVTYTITPASASSCPGQSFMLTVTVAPLPIITATPANTLICSNQPGTINLLSNVTGTSYTWTSTVTGNVVGNGNQATPVTITSIADVLTNSGTTQGSVTYTITPYNNGSCAGSPAKVTINVQPEPVAANAGMNDEVCNTTNYTLKGNNPTPATGKWTVASGQTGITFSDDTQPNAVVSGLVPGNTYKFTWTITAASTCPPSISTVTIVVDKPSIGGTTAGSKTVCAGSNNGNIILSGQSGNILRWESSTDNGSTWNPVNNTTGTLLYHNLTQSTQYRAVVQSAICAIDYSSVTVITVNAATVAANAGPDKTLCNQATYTLQAVDPAPFTGTWTQTGGPLVTIVDPSNPLSQVTGLQGGNIYKFTWTIKGLPPCSDIPDEVIITDALDVTPSFTTNTVSGCGSTQISFKNTSTSITGVTFLWDFGDGSPSSNEINPVHTFAPLTNGKDITYTVTLTVVNNCTLHAPASAQITVSPAMPVAVIQANSLSGCAPFTITAQNHSPGTNKSYDFYLYNGSTLVQHLPTKTDNSDAVFDPISPKTTQTYDLYMVATNNCGTTAESNHIHIVISPPDVSPQFDVKEGVYSGCAPFAVTFVNNSLGGTAYYYNIYDASGKLISHLPAGTSDFPYTFNTPGDYSVTILAVDACTPNGLESPKTYFHVYAVPAPAFKADVLKGCKTLPVQFTNNTPADASGTPAQSLNYLWDFGDNTTSTAFAPQHTYTKPGNYTVTLTATNNTTTHCANTAVLTNYINVTAPPDANFRIDPDSVISIPNYHFGFTDETTGSTPTTWLWTFGDGSSSRSQNPTHTYADTGRYAVTLIVSNGSDCPGTITHYVRITGIPGQLYVPNAFMPTGSSDELRTFKAKGSGIKVYHLQIFNNWGQLVWETTKLDSKGEPIEGWDGTFKGAPVPQGVYIWEMSATFINGTDWKGMSYNGSLPKRTGPIHLLR